MCEQVVSGKGVLCSTTCAIASCGTNCATLCGTSCTALEHFDQMCLKRIKYEIRLGEPNGSMSMGQKKVKPILCVESLTKRRPRLVHHVSDS